VLAAFLTAILAVAQVADGGAITIRNANKMGGPTGGDLHTGSGQAWPLVTNQPEDRLWTTNS